MTFNEFQDKVTIWSDYNFGSKRGIKEAATKLIGVQEELGELSHSVLKSLQGIRNDEYHIEDAQDAVGDLMLYLADFCKTMGFSLEECANIAWEEVKDRDWKKFPNNGKTS